MLLAKRPWWGICAYSELSCAFSTSSCKQRDSSWHYPPHFDPKHDSTIPPRSSVPRRGQNQTNPTPGTSRSRAIPHLTGVPSSPDQLVGLVLRQQFGAAERLLVHLTDQHRVSEIAPHPVYESAALDALRWDDEDLVLGIFSRWLSLVPDIATLHSTFAHVTQSTVIRTTHNKHTASTLSPALWKTEHNIIATFLSDPFRQTRRLLFHTGNPAQHIRLIKRFALICASKGYIHSVYTPSTNLLLNRLEAAQFAEFLDRIEHLAVTYQRSVDPPLPTNAQQRHLTMSRGLSSRSSSNATELTRYLRESAIKLLHAKNWIKYAKKVFKRNALDENVVLRDHIFEYALKWVTPKNISETKPTSQSAKYIRFLQQLRKVERRKEYERVKVSFEVSGSEGGKEVV
ncbi:hypothetical protein AMATHDRAFT_67045 [Amanita thiersii Skay4041]|uniref:Uncharacterized protein n=1 Tax=Amanita thiersii Skay4041 TaxID=703135 RepID=A0A2A9NEG9_9AGAR|nr:hypothetical protein AMATHDRAFT_67045 [Amanita thiersii Skay4041]